MTIRYSRQVAYLEIGSDQYPIRIIGSDLWDALTRSGYNPAEYNRITWPTGASRPSSGMLLFDSGTMQRILGAGSGTDIPTCSLVMGTEGSTITLASMSLGSPRPIFVRAQGYRIAAPDEYASHPDHPVGLSLYAVPITDKRKYWSKANTEDYNIRAAGAMVKYLTDTTIDASTQYGYDQVIADLASNLGETITITGAWAGSSKPVNVVGEGVPIARLIDEMCAETGRILGLSLSGSAAINYIDSTKVTSVISSNISRLISGCAYYAPVGASLSGHLREVTPLTIWSVNDIPNTTRVTFPGFSAASIERSDDYSTSGITATTAGLTGKTGYQYWIQHHAPAIRGSTGAIINNAELDARATDLTTAYFRRFKAGGMDAIFEGIIDHTASQSAQTAEWVLDGIGGFHTRIYQDLNDPIYGLIHRMPDTMIRATGAIRASPAACGGVILQTEQQTEHVQVGRVTARSATSGTAITYTIDADTGAKWTMGSAGNAKTPLFRPVGSTVKINAAAVGSAATFRVKRYTDSTTPEIELLSVAEQIATAECAGPTPSVVDIYWITSIVSDRLGDVVSDRTGTLTQDITGFYTGLTPDLVITDRYGNPPSDRLGRCIFSKTLGEAQIPALDAIITDRYGNVVTDRTGEVTVGTFED